MPLDPAYLEYLQRQFAFAEWRVSDGAADVAQSVEAFTGKELPGWTLRRGTRRTGEDGVPLIRGIWSLSPDNDTRLLDVEVWLCGTPAAAREYLLSVLGDMQGPVASRADGGAPGEVAFRLGGDSAMAFARGRAVVRVRNAGRQVSSVATEAAQLDSWLQGKPAR
jgi:hypothetical protein